jgi:hypothetical protein
MPMLSVLRNRAGAMRAVTVAVMTCAAAIAVPVVRAHAQTATDAPPLSQATPKPPKPFCFRGRPATACRAFMLTEVGYYAPVVTSRTRYRYQQPDGYPQYEYIAKDLDDVLSFEIGAMQNRTPTTAVGGTVQFTFGTGAAIAVKGRYRRWLTPQGLSLDFGAGPVLLGQANSASGANTPGLTGDVALNAHDFGALVVRTDVLRTRGKTAYALYGGARLGAQPALVGTAILTAGFIVLLNALSQEFN